MSDEATQNDAGKNNVIVVDLGKKKRKQVKALRNGKGKLMKTVQEVLSSLHEEGTASSGDTVVVIVEKKDKKVRMRTPFKW